MQEGKNRLRSRHHAMTVPVRGPACGPRRTSLQGCSLGSFIQSDCFRTAMGTSLPRGTNLIFFDCSSLVGLLVSLPEEGAFNISAIVAQGIDRMDAGIEQN